MVLVGKLICFRIMVSVIMFVLGMVVVLMDVKVVVVIIMMNWEIVRLIL